MDKSTLGEKIINRLQQHKRELAQQQQRLDTRMKEMLEERERLFAIGRRWIEEVILPRMKELEKHFDNGKVEISNPKADLLCACDFAHTTRFPATVRVSFLLLPNDDSLTVRYNLNIFPSLMEHTHNLEENFSAKTSNDILATWIEDRLIDFLDAYLRLETHPLYQKDNMVTDIICGMQIPLISATSRIEKSGRTIYFCSEHCKNVFLNQNG